jgi:hypothetical protein
MLQVTLVARIYQDELTRSTVMSVWNVLCAGFGPDRGTWSAQIVGRLRKYVDCNVNWCQQLHAGTAEFCTSEEAQRSLDAFTGYVNNIRKYVDCNVNWC